ncbi:hypothetical protein RCO28_26595 [Streptomyces sp. LHD-70]|uniref:hypothetical protein n=1 Tax=Streptomyces sp. LHD-70 TaxID=3072140 RepID=UPI00280F135E|nr:hypothetical protein [Streptomyces sp. LHD-70]MDQ8706020.1 hypothetical protein [Streptomyces sp. LHD-70]
MEAAEQIGARGGTAIAVHGDHRRDEEIATLFDRVKAIAEAETPEFVGRVVIALANDPSTSGQTANLRGDRGGRRHHGGGRSPTTVAPWRIRWRTRLRKRRVGCGPRSTADHRIPLQSLRQSL